MRLLRLQHVEIGPRDRIIRRFFAIIKATPATQRRFISPIPGAPQLYMWRVSPLETSTKRFFHKQVFLEDRDCARRILKNQAFERAVSGLVLEGCVFDGGRCPVCRCDYFPVCPAE
jgi:hypothetical protein